MHFSSEIQGVFFLCVYLRAGFVFIFVLMAYDRAAGELCSGWNNSDNSLLMFPLFKATPQLWSVEGQPLLRSIVEGEMKSVQGLFERNRPQSMKMNAEIGAREGALRREA